MKIFCKYIYKSKVLVNIVMFDRVQLARTRCLRDEQKIWTCLTIALNNILLKISLLTVDNEVFNFYVLANETIILSFEYIILSKVLHASL